MRKPVVASSTVVMIQLLNFTGFYKIELNKGTVIIYGYTHNFNAYPDLLL